MINNNCILPFNLTSEFLAFLQLSVTSNDLHGVFLSHILLVLFFFFPQGLNSDNTDQLTN